MPDAERRLYDISLPLHPGTREWPGDQPYASRFTWDQRRGDSATVGAIELSTHFGTHVDAPLHVRQDGAAVHELDLEALIGPATLIDVTGFDPITIASLESRGHALRPRLLLRTGGWPDPGRFPDRIPLLAPEVAAYLQRQGVRLLGLDVPSVDRVDDPALPLHHALIAAGIHILESLDLRGVPEGLYTLSALPLKLVGMDAAPVRAVLIAED